MALGTDVLRLLVQADASGAVKEFQKLGKGIEDSGDKAATGFKGSLTKAFDGLQAKSGTASAVFDKIGLSSSQAAGAIATAIPFAAAAAGGALVAFAAKGVSAFQETALAAGKFADSTGLSVETASKYIAVADDIGVGADTIQNAFIKMEKQIGANRDAFKGLIGADPSATFQNVITHLQGIHDPLQRATESAKFFGKGFAEVSELINTDAGQIASALDKVSAAQIITPAELAKARDYRAAMDNLKDSVGDVQREIGGQLVPSLAKLANAAAKTITITVDFAVKGADILDQANKASGGFLQPIVDAAKSAVNPVGESLNTITGAYHTFLDATKQAGLGASTLGQGFDAMKTKAQEMGTAIGPAGTSMGDFVRQATAANVAAHQLADDGGNRLAEAYKNVAAAAKESNDAIQANSNAQLAAFDATFAVKNAQDQFATSLMAAETAAASGTASAGELTQAYDKETQAAEAVAVATVQKAEKDAIASGKALTAKQSNDLLIATLQAQAAQASGPTKAALNGLIADLQAVGNQHPQPTVTVADHATQPIASIAGAARALDAISPTISVNANVSAAKAAVNGLISGLNSLSSITGKSFAHIAKGTTNFAGGLALVGEQGPELVYLPSGSAVSTAAKTQKIMESGPSPMALSGSGGGTGTVVQITVNGAVDPYSTARQIQKILATGSRSGFSTLAA